MRVYHERLGVPASWWLTAAACVLLLGSTIWAGFSVVAGAAAYGGLSLLCAVTFFVWGRMAITVTDSEVVTGRQRIPLDRIGDVEALDAAQTSALRGPRADPAAYLLIRPYLPMSVYVEIAGRPADRPYVLLASRRPQQLAAAIQDGRAAAGRRLPCDDDRVDADPVDVGSANAGSPGAGSPDAGSPDVGSADFGGSDPVSHGVGGSESPVAGSGKVSGGK